MFNIIIFIFLNSHQNRLYHLMRSCPHGDESCRPMCRNLLKGLFPLLLLLLWERHKIGHIWGQVAMAQRKAKRARWISSIKHDKTWWKYGSGDDLDMICGWFWWFLVYSQGQEVANHHQISPNIIEKTNLKKLSPQIRNTHQTSQRLANDPRWRDIRWVGCTTRHAPAGPSSVPAEAQVPGEAAKLAALPRWSYHKNMEHHILQ